MTATSAGEMLFSRPEPEREPAHSTRAAVTMRRRTAMHSDLPEDHQLFAPPVPALTAIARFGQRLIGGGKRLIAIFLYLYLMLVLFNLHEYVILQQHQIAFTKFGWAFVNALVMAKVMLVADELHLGARLERLPLIYPVLGKSLIFAVVLVAFRIVEDIAVGLWHGLTFVESVPAVGGGGLLGVVVVGVIVTVALVPFFALHEITTVIGSRQLYDLLFRLGRKD